jgi:hypothetical protein
MQRQHQQGCTGELRIHGEQQHQIERAGAKVHPHVAHRRTHELLRRMDIRGDARNDRARLMLLKIGVAEPLDVLEQIVAQIEDDAVAGEIRPVAAVVHRHAPYGVDGEQRRGQDAELHPHAASGPGDRKMAGNPMDVALGGLKHRVGGRRRGTDVRREPIGHEAQDQRKSSGQGELKDAAQRRTGDQRPVRAHVIQEAAQR